MTTLTVGIDMGGSLIKAVARRASGEIVDRYEASTDFRGGAQVTAAAVTAFRAIGSHDCAVVGLGVPGRVDPATGEVSLALNLGIDEPYDLGPRVASALGVPVVVENDVRAAAMGAYESLAMVGSAPGSLVLMSIGTGISAGVVLDGVLVRGAHGMAGEIGHVVMDASGPVCRCGQRGCLEVFSAGPAIGRAWPKGDADAPGTALFNAVAAGDPAARRVADRIVGHLTTALTWLAAAYDSELIVLAGGVASVGDEFLRVIREQVVERAAASELAARRLGPEQVILADNFDPPGPRGAALLAFMHSLPRRVSPASKQATNSK